MAKFQVNYNHRRVRGKIGKIVIDLEPEKNNLNKFSDLNNFFDALEEKGFTTLEIENDLELLIRNLENGKQYYLDKYGSGLVQRR